MNMEHLTPVVVPRKEWFEGRFNNRHPEREDRQPLCDPSPVVASS
jgi:hypothetical protein